MSLEPHRDRIDRLDAQIVRLLNERAEAGMTIGRLKGDRKMGAYAPERERDVLDRVVRENPGPLPHDALRAIYQEIVASTLSLEDSLRIAFWGPSRDTAYRAARVKFGEQSDYFACENAEAVCTAVRNGKAHYGVVPVDGGESPASLSMCSEWRVPVLGAEGAPTDSLSFAAYGPLDAGSANAE